MADAHASVVDLSRLDREALEALVVAQQEKLLTRNSEIEHLKLIIAKLRRMMFGTKSEKIAREVEQLELKLEELETGKAARPPAGRPPAAPLGENGSVVHCLSIYHAKPTRICLLKKPAQRAVASCASWAKMSPRCWSTSQLASK
jgi:Transposase C of IS166 homeodomain